MAKINMTNAAKNMRNARPSFTDGGISWIATLKMSVENCQNDKIDSTI